MHRTYPRKRMIFLLFIIGWMLCVVSSLSVNAGSEQPQIGVFYNSSSLHVNELSKSMDFKDLYTSVVANESLNTSTIVLNGNVVTLVKLPAGSIAVRLPEDRIALKVSEENSSLLPVGSSVSYYDEQPILIIPQKSEVLAVSSVVISPIEIFTNGALFSQSISELDRYVIEVMFPEVTVLSPKDSVVSYTVDWGDGQQNTYTLLDARALHMYPKNGTYLLKLNVTDTLGFTYGTTHVVTIHYEGNVAHSYLWAKKNKEPVALTTCAGFGFLAIGLVAFTENGRYRLLVVLALLFPMYTRILKEDVLDQFVRGQIYGYIKTNPGVHYNKILREVGVKNGTLSYHLGVLEKSALIQSRREGLKYRAFYPKEMNFPKKERFRLTGLQISIIGSIRDHPGLTQKEIARLLGHKPQTINYNMKVLDQAGLVRVVKKGRKTRCFPVEGSLSSSSFL